jgi:cell division protein FtsB
VNNNNDYIVQNASRNTLMILVIVIGVFIILIGPVRNYFIEAEHVSSLNSELKRSIAEKEYMQGELDRLKDDKFVIAYAREHYALIMPGETAIHITDPDSIGTARDIYNFDEADANYSPEATNALNKYKTPWYEKMYQSFTAPTPESAPTTPITPAPAPAAGPDTTTTPAPVAGPESGQEVVDGQSN